MKKTKFGRYKDNINEENNIKKGDYIIIKRKNNEIFAKLLIEDIKKEKEKNEIILNCEEPHTDKKKEINDTTEKKDKNNKENIIIKQKIYLSIKEIQKNMSFCEFKHIWYELISDQKIKFLNFLKNNSLILFKKQIEESYEKISKNKQETNDENNNKLKNNKSKVLKKDDNKNEFEIINFFNLLCPVKNNKKKIKLI